MDDHALSSDDNQALAALWALSALEEPEAAAFVTQMQADPTLADDVHAFERVRQLLGYGAAPVSPPAALRDRLQHALRSAPVHPLTASSETPLAPTDALILRSNAGVWEAGPSPGMSMRTLFLDTARQYITQLVRLDSGAQVAPHWHPEAEECYVVEGSFSVDAHTFQAGDYIRMPAGSVHNTITSETGCVLFVVASTGEMPH